MSQSVLLEAEGLIHGDRNAAYGHPLDDFSCSAEIIRALVKRRFGLDVPFDAEFVALMMACAIKGSREAGRPKRDNRVDGPGYWGCLDMVIEERVRRQQVIPNDSPGKEAK